MEPLGPERTLVSAGVRDTLRLGEALGRLLAPGDVVGLSGTLGAGKTAFVRGVAGGTGADVDEVSSPTYAVIQSYPGRVLLHHVDLYRLESGDELYATGFFDLEAGACLVEWIDRAPAVLPESALLVRLEATGEGARALHVSARGPRGTALLAGWLSSAGS